MKRPPKVSGYGRSKPVEHVTAEQRETPRCQKCRSLAMDEAPPKLVCRKGNILGTAEACPDYTDCSRPRDYFANFDYNGRFRR